MSKKITIELPDKNMFFSGNISTKEDENLSLQLVLDVLWYHIWTCKLEEKNPGNLEFIQRNK